MWYTVCIVINSKVSSEINSEKKVAQSATSTVTSDVVAQRNNSLAELVAHFRSKGGKINTFYLRASMQSKRSLVHLNGWHSGRNIKEAILKALSVSNEPIRDKDEGD